MNFVSKFSKDSKTALSKLGLNVFLLLKKHNGEKRPYSIEQVLYTVYLIKDKLIKNEFDIIYDIVDSRLLKNSTFFKQVYIYDTNFIPEKIIEIIQRNDNKKQILINRLDLIITILKPNNNTN